MSYRKAQTIYDACMQYINGNIDYYNLNDLSDIAIIKKLTKIKGIGIWTAQMILMFSLNRMNILSYEDFAIRKGICNIYNYEKLDKKTFNIYYKRYSPYASVASLYIWNASVMDKDEIQNICK